MGVGRRVRELAILLLAAAAVACSKKDDVREAPGAAAATAAAAARPVDHLVKGELLEGADNAFGLTLPRGTRLDRQFIDVAFATSQSTVAELVPYFRARVRGGTFMQGEHSATFEHVKAPSRPGIELRLTLTELTNVKTNLELRDTTPPAVPEYPDEDSRWRAAGLNRNGKPLDPTHVE